ncbi:MAG: GDP-mannose 4,6-dehydratase [Candidatus Eisenbacteria bacterium]|nr:GDP-mannose 4,6-dehydratase [Candidatus Eisenbacteria bacterium]
MTKSVLITGAAGFVGQHLAEQLCEDGAARAEGVAVHGVDLPGIPAPADLYAEWFQCDVTDAAHVAAVIGQVRPDYVFHLAALLKSESLVDLLRINVVGTQNVLDALVEVKPEARVLVTGSSAEYGLVHPGELPVREENELRPLSPYGVSKAAQSLLAVRYAYRYSMTVIRTRTFNLTGPGEPDSLVCSAFAKQIAEIEMGKSSPTLKVGNLGTERDFTDVRDAVRAYWLAIRHGKAGQVYNVSSGVATPIRDMLDTLLAMASTSTRIQIQELAERRTAWDVPSQLGNAARLSEMTGWKPEIPLKQSLKDNLDSWRSSLAK